MYSLYVWHITASPRSFFVTTGNYASTLRSSICGVLNLEQDKVLDEPGAYLSGLSSAHMLCCLMGIPVVPFPVSLCFRVQKKGPKSRACPLANLQHPHMLIQELSGHTHTHTHARKLQLSHRHRFKALNDCKIIMCISVTVKNRLKEATDG